jgi:predicted deacylase
MDSRARLVMIVAASLAAGFAISELAGYRAGQMSAERQPGPVYDKDPNGVEIQSEPLPLPTIVVEEPPSPMPLPAMEPSIAYQLEEPEPAPVLVEPPVVEALAEATEAGDGEQSTDAVEDEPIPDLEYVAMLHHDGADVTAGFDSLEPGTLTRMTWQAGESLYGSSIPTPVLVAQGANPGPTLCVTSAVHGDELNGIETVRRLMYSLNPEKLNGRVVGVPIVNLQGFERHSRYLPDRRDLNRFFPGNPKGSSASRIAFSFFQQVVRHCDALVDLHTGSFHRTNLPQLRANLLNEAVIELTESFGGLVILHSTGGVGTLRASAVAAGIPAVTLEAGEPLRVDDKAVDHSVRSLYTLMDNLQMYNRRSLWGNPEPTYYGSMWVRADKGGMLIGEVKLGKRVKAGEVLGTVTDPITNSTQHILAPEAGRIIGMALNQFVMPGYAAFHLGVEAPAMDDLQDTPGADDIDHSIAVADGLMEGRDDSD